MTRIVRAGIWGAAGVTLSLLNGVAAFYFTNVTAVFWSVVRGLEPASKLLLPGTLACANALWYAQGGTLDCVAALAFSLAATLLTPPLIVTILKRQEVFWRLVVCVGVGFTVAVVFGGTFLFVPILYLLPGGTEVSRLFVVTFAVALTAFGGIVATISAIPVGFLGGLTLSLLNVGLVRFLQPAVSGLSTPSRLNQSRRESTTPE